MLLNRLLGDVKAQHLRDTGANDGSEVALLIVYSLALSLFIPVPVVYLITTERTTPPGSLRLPSERRQLSSIWVGYPCSGHLCLSNTVSTPPSNPSWYLLNIGDHMSKRLSFLTETASEVSGAFLKMKLEQSNQPPS